MEPNCNQTELDRETCRRARLSRDHRFDGEFFLAVRTTGIYCRPVCPARPPAEKNVSYFRSAAEAAAAGYRPCLRCRPEAAPGSAAWQGSSTTVRRALQLIRQGALNEGKLGLLADRLGVGERYLRKLFQRELGVSPRTVALNHRLLFAKQLLAETPMPVTEVAFAAGFGSVRRFNSTFQEQLRLTPGEVRRRASSSRPGSGLRLQLHYRPPYDWPGVIAFFQRHAIEGVEQVTAESYGRNIRLEGATGAIRVRPEKNRHALQLEIKMPDHRLLMQVVARVRRMFDLDANPGAIAGVLGADEDLAGLLAETPGVRSPGHWSLFESAARAVIGQQVSVAAARTVCARLALATTTPGEPTCFPAPEAIAALDDAHFPMPGRRRETLRRLCHRFNEASSDLEPDSLADIPGIGPWTLEMITLRGIGDPDVFPARDLGLEKAWTRHRPNDTELARHAEAHWRPWRSYAANLFWRSL
jgi:AraC family transcriptional regulator of adaptative response / DNA-3-methyladenine glycosylase II